MINLLTETPDFSVDRLLLIAKKDLSPKRYGQFYRALERHLIELEKSGHVWRAVAEIDSKLNERANQNIIEKP